MFLKWTKQHHFNTIKNVVSSRLFYIISLSASISVWLMHRMIWATLCNGSYHPVCMWVCVSQRLQCCCRSGRGQPCLPGLYSNRRWLKAVSALSASACRGHFSRPVCQSTGGKVQTGLSQLPSQSDSLAERPAERRPGVTTLKEDITPFVSQH